MTQPSRVSRRRLPAPTDRLTVRRGLRVSPLCVGIVDDPRTVAAAFEAGINFFFLTADMHWPLYDATRRGLRQLFRARPAVRDEVVVAAACYPTQPDFNTTPFEEVVDAVPGLDRVDVALMGGAYGGDFMARYPIYARHRTSRHVGIRAIGATFHDREAVAPAVNHGLLDVAFTRYNPAHPGAREDLFPLLDRRAGTPLFNFTNSSGYVEPARRAELGVPADLWQPAPEDCHRFALSRPELAGLLCAPATPRRLRRIIDALARGPLSTDEEHILINLARLDAGEAELARDDD